jgi:Tfp pilus assembly protein FimV
LRRLLPGAATLAVLVGSWIGVGALAASANAVTVVRLPGTVPVHGGLLYVAKPGDTLWSIATRVEPGADPRSLVDSLENQLNGNVLLPGDRLVLPR